MITQYVWKQAQDAANFHGVSFAIVPNSNSARKAIWQLQVIPEGEPVPVYALGEVHPSIQKNQLLLNL